MHARGSMGDASGWAGHAKDASQHAGSADASGARSRALCAVAHRRSRAGDCGAGRRCRARGKPVGGSERAQADGVGAIVSMGPGRLVGRQQNRRADGPRDLDLCDGVGAARELSRPGRKTDGKPAPVHLRCPGRAGVDSLGTGQARQRWGGAFYRREMGDAQRRGPVADEADRARAAVGRERAATVGRRKGHDSCVDVGAWFRRDR